MPKKLLRYAQVCISAATLLIAVTLFISGCDIPDTDAKMETEDHSDENILVENRNDGMPVFAEQMLARTDNFISYRELDSLGRATGMIAILSAEGIREESEDISPEVVTTGFHVVWYDRIETRTGKNGAYLWRRCHLLKSKLGGSADDERNFITGTYALNYSPGMGAYETQIIKYLKSSGNHVLYRVTPVYEDDNLVASGVTLEAISLEDNGNGICFHVFIKNIQPGIHIDYETGFSYQER